MSSSPMLSRPTRGARDAVHVARDDRAHRRELGELLRRGLGVGAEIEHVGMAVDRRDRRHDGRALDACDRPQNEMRHGGERTGVACADAGERRARFHEVDGDAHRRVLLAPDRPRAASRPWSRPASRRESRRARARTRSTPASSGSMMAGCADEQHAQPGISRSARSAPPTYAARRGRRSSRRWRMAQASARFYAREIRRGLGRGPTYSWSSTRPASRSRACRDRTHRA